MAELIVFEQLATYLAGQGLVTQDLDHPSATVPSVWTNPRDGAPWPRDGEAGTVTLIEVTTAPDNDLSPWVEISFIEVVTRFPEERYGILCQRAIRDLLAPRDSLAGRKQWQMAGLAVQRSKVFTGDQAAAQDEHAYTRSQTFQIDCTRTALAGL